MLGPSEIQLLEQQHPTLSEQHALESIIYVQEQPRSIVNEVERPYEKDNSIPFVLLFGSQDVAPSS
jgi:hypothetical protein